MADHNSSTTAQQTTQPAAPPIAGLSPPSPSQKDQSAATSAWTSFVGHLKNVREVLVAISAIAAAVAFALNYFATSRALECFKAEARNSNELVQTVLQINDLTTSWQLTTVRLRQLDQKSLAPNVAPDSVEYEVILKEIAATQSQSDAITKQLSAARDRKLDLERSGKKCE